MDTTLGILVITSESIFIWQVLKRFVWLFLCFWTSETVQLVHFLSACFLVLMQDVDEHCGSFPDFFTLIGHAGKMFVE